MIKAVLLCMRCMSADCIEAVLSHCVLLHATLFPRYPLFYLCFPDVLFFPLSFIHLCIHTLHHLHLVCVAYCCVLVGRL